MKKLLFILLFLPLLFSCGGEKDNLDRRITWDDIDNEYTGKGTKIMDTKNVYNSYIGEWKDGEHHGYGTYFWHTKTTGSGKYEGEWKEGMFHGHGVWEKRGVGKYEGEWKDGLKNGQGTFTYPDGRIKKGLWENSNFLGE
tara:strand:- start:1366 stop:1785 length:420 start_codon:yes stop_codon:yes gene_type:complete